MDKVGRLIVLLKILQLELELEFLKRAQDSLQKESNTVDSASTDKLLNDVLRDKIDVSAIILPDNSIQFLVKTYPWRK